MLLTQVRQCQQPLASEERDQRWKERLALVQWQHLVQLQQLGSQMYLHCQVQQGVLSWQEATLPQQPGLMKVEQRV
jgi:hypothetical protein